MPTIDELRKQLAKMQGGGSFIKLEEMNKFGIIQPREYTGLQDLAFEYRSHYLREARKFYTCLKEKGEDCPICLLHKTLREDGFEKEAKPYNSGTRYLVNVLNTLNGKTGKTEFPYTVWKDILTEIIEEMEADTENAEWVLYEGGGRILQISEKSKQPLQYKIKLLSDYFEIPENFTPLVFSTETLYFTEADKIWPEVEKIFTSFGYNV